MAKYIKDLKHRFKYKGKNITAEMEISLSRFERQYNKAQYVLDSTIMTHMVPFMPMDTGQFVNVTRAMSASLAGTGIVVAAAPPFGRFLYEGLLMVDEETGSAFARAGARKVLLSEFGGKTGVDHKLDFSTSAHPDVTDHWFDAAKKKHGKNWVALAKKYGGGG